MFPEKKKDNFDRVMEVASVFLDGTVGTVFNGINSLFQTYALIQGRKEARKIVKYTCDLEEMKLKSKVEMRRLDLLEQEQQQRYNLQRTMLTLYVDRQFQASVDQMTRAFHETSYMIESSRYNAIREIDRYTKSVVQGMDVRYQQIIRQEEAICAAYRNELKYLEQHNIHKWDIISALIQKTEFNSLNDQKYKIFYDFLSSAVEPNFIAFDDYIRMRSAYSTPTYDGTKQYRKRKR